MAGLMEQDICSGTTSHTNLEIDDPFHEDFYDHHLELLGFASFGLMRQFQVPWQHPTLDKPYDEYDDGHLPGAVEWGTSLQPNNGVHLNREEVSQALSGRCTVLLDSTVPSSTKSISVTVGGCNSSNQEMTT